jgi:hypothetical protein
MGRPELSLRTAMHKPPTRLSDENLNNEIRRLVEDCHTIRYIRQALGLTKHGLYCRMARMRLRGIALSNPQGRNQWNIDSPFLGLRSYCKTVEQDPRRASIMHLVDLKRAGHSAKQTEYAIAPDGSSRVSPFHAYHGSLVGSAAAMCESA